MQFWNGGGGGGREGGSEQANVIDLVLVTVLEN